MGSGTDARIGFDPSPGPDLHDVGHSREEHEEGRDEDGAVCTRCAVGARRHVAGRGLELIVRHARPQQHEPLPGEFQR